MRISRILTCALLAVLSGTALCACGGGRAFPPLNNEPVTPLRAAPDLVTVKPPPLGPPSAQPPAPIALNSGWRYLPDPDDVGLAEGWWHGGAADANWTSVSLPHDFNPTISRGGPRPGAGWYELRFEGPRTAEGRSWQLAFESVRRHATVWLNGQQIGSSDDPYAPFSLPATALRPRQPNVLLVRVDNVKPPGELPEDWWNWGGIVGPVTLVPVGRLELTDTAVTPELGCAYRCGDLVVQGTLVNHSQGTLSPRLRITITPPAGGSSTTRSLALPPLGPGRGEPVRWRVPVPGRLSLWSPSHPALYRARIQTLSPGRIEQQQLFRPGMRAVEVRDGILDLNGTRLWLHGAAIHEDVAGRGAAISDKDIAALVAQLRSLGANITRAHYLLSPRLLDALDAAGIMVWEEPPVEHADQQLATSAGRSRALALLRSTVEGARNHPSVIVDSVGNELTPTPDTTPGTASYLAQATSLARQLNPTVPVALDIYCYPGYPVQRSYASLQVLGISDYFGWYGGPPGHSIADFSELRPYLAATHARYPGKALVISEYGAEGLFAGSPEVKGTYQFQSDYVKRTLRVLDRLPFMDGSIYWTLREFAVAPGWRGGAVLPAGLVPDGIHHKGLIAYDGRAKPAFSVAAGLLSRVPSFVSRGAAAATRSLPSALAR